MKKGEGEFGALLALSEGMKNLIVFISLIAVGSTALSRDLSKEPNNGRSAPVTDQSLDLFALNQRETSHLTPAQVALLNKDMHDRLTDFRPPANSRRARSVTFRDAQQTLNAIARNPVTGSSGIYEQSDVSIGYCFGRATFAHLLLLRMGVQKESILKMWAVGPMQAGGVAWQFHVTTLVFSRDRGWIVIDTNNSQPETIGSWMKRYEAMSTDKKLRFYLSDASKFGIGISKYNRVDLGLGLERDNDWYKGYFADMMAQLRSKNLDQLGVSRVAPEGPNDRDTFTPEKR